jgi:hypothetical protein
MKPEVPENEDETSTTVSEQVQVNTDLDIPSLSNNLQLTMAAVTELKLPLQELLELFSRGKSRYKHLWMLFASQKDSCEVR